MMFFLKGTFKKKELTMCQNLCNRFPRIGEKRTKKGFKKIIGQKKLILVKLNM